MVAIDKSQKLTIKKRKRQAREKWKKMEIFGWKAAKAQY